MLPSLFAMLLAWHRLVPHLPGIRSLLSFKQSVQGVSVNVSHDNTVDVAVSLRVQSGRSLNEIADNVRKSVADAVLSQVGLTVSRVDIRVDGIVFQD